MDGASGRLHIGATDGSHAGRYTCRATNEVAGVGIIGDISTSADVYVIGTWPDGDYSGMRVILCAKYRSISIFQ